METQKHSLDMLHGSLWNRIPCFALPVAATAILEQLFNASDVAVVGNFTGAEKNGGRSGGRREQPDYQPDRQPVYRHRAGRGRGNRTCRRTG